MKTSTSVDEEQHINNAAREEILIKELNEAPVIYEWNVNAPPFTVFIAYCISVAALSIAVGVWLSISKASWAPFIICTIFGFVMVAYLRYLCMPNKIYQYQLTPIGIRYTIQDAIPEVAYKIVRMLAWVGVAVCIFAFGVLGPLAFVGAGGMALLAFGMTNFSSQIRKAHICYVDNFRVNILKKRDMFSLENYPSECYQSGSIFCKADEVELILDKIQSFINITSVKEVKSSRHLFS